MAIQPVTVPNLYGGISQKSERLRALNEFQDVLNCDVSLEDGMYKRNGSVYVSALEMDVSANNAYVHTFIKSEDEHYFMVMDGSAVKIYDNSGVQRSIKYGSLDASTYFSGTGGGIENPRDVFNTVTIGDGVVVNRRDVVTRMSPELTDPADGSVAYLFVKQAQYGYIPFKWWFNLSGEAYYGQIQTGPDAAGEQNKRNADGFYHLLGINTEALAIYIMATINNTSTVNSGPAGSLTEAYANWSGIEVSATKSTGSTVRIFTTDGAPFENFNVADGLGDDGLILMWKTANNLFDLPLDMPDETPIIRILGNKSDLSDDFYVRFVKEAFSQESQYSYDSQVTGTTGSIDPGYDNSGVDVTLNDLGAWRECAGFSLKYKFDTATMPHVIVQRPDGSFLVNKMDGDAFSVDNNDTPDNTTSFFSDGPNGWLTFSGTSTHDFVVGDRVQLSYVSGTNLDIEAAQVSATFPSSILPDREYYVKEIDGNTKIRISETAVSDHITYTTETGTGAGPYYPAVNVVAKTYKKFKYGEREAGDDVTNPVPSFIDNPINDMVLHRNRLAFISRDAVTLSEFGELFNFFRITVQDILDTAPIEVQTGDNITRELYNAVSYKNTLLVFSKEGQFALIGEPSLTPESVNFTLATAYRSNTQVRPFVLGDRLYFFEKRRRRNFLHEIIERDFKLNYLGRDVTEKAPNILKGNIQVVTTNGQDTVAIVTDNDLGEIITYTIKVDQARGLISAWHRYTLNDIEIESMKYVDDIIQIVGLYEGKHRMLLTLEKDPNFDDAYLDVKLTSGTLGTGSYDSINDETTYTIPFETETSGWVAVDEDTKQTVNFNDITSTTFVVEGDTTSRNMVFGRAFTSRIGFSRFYPQSRQGQGPVVNDQVVIDEFLVSFDQNNYQTFDMSAIVDNGKSYVKTYTSNTLNTKNLDSAINPTDFASCFVQSRNRDCRVYITNDTFVPFNLINFEYSISEGQKRHTR